MTVMPQSQIFMLQIVKTSLVICFLVTRLDLGRARKIGTKGKLKELSFSHSLLEYNNRTFHRENNVDVIAKKLNLYENF